MMTLAAASLMALAQTAEEAPSVIAEGDEYTIEAEQWELSYDIAMLPYIDDYKRCLGYGDRLFDGKPNVEEQHRADIPRCEDVKAEGIAQSNAVLTRRGRAEEFSPDMVERAFFVLGQIHVQRGRNFDDRVQLQIRASQERQRRYAAQIAARDAARAAQRAQNSPSTENNNAEN